MFGRILQILVHGLLIRPIVFVIFGLGIRDRHKLPTKGPAIVVANHNSHLDTGVMMSLFPIRRINRVRPVGAAEYWVKSKGFVSWFVLTIMGIIPMDRGARARGEDPFVEVSRALDQGDILIVYPEGSRGEPERMAALKKGISHLVEAHPDVPVTPVFLRGVGKALPRGSWLPVPLFVDVWVGDDIHWTGDRDSYMDELRRAIANLARQGRTVKWSEHE